MFNSKLGDEKSRESGAVWGILKGMLVGVASASVLALVFTLVALMNEDPDKLLGGLAYAALTIGALASGIASPKEGMNPILSSALSGGGYAVVIWLASIPFRANGESELAPLVSLFLYLACVVVSMIGGFIFRRKPAKLTSTRKSPAAMVRKQLGRR